MATYTSPYKSGTIQGVSGTTVTLSTALVSGDVGRLICFTEGSAINIHRRITGVSGSNITIDHPFNVTNFPAITDVNPSVGDAYSITYRESELGDATRQDENYVKYSGSHAFRGRTWAHIENKNVELDSRNWSIEQRCGVIFGYYKYVAGQNAIPVNSCNITDIGSGTSANNWGDGGNGSDTGLLDIYGGKHQFPNTLFWRNYDDAVFTQVRLVDVVMQGNFGSRLQGNRSIVLATAIGSASVFGFANPVGALPIFALTVIDCSQGLYVNGGLGPTGEATFVKISNVEKIIRYTASGTGEYKIIGPKSEIDKATYYLESDANAPNNGFEYGNIIKPSYSNPATPFSGTIKTRLRDVTGASIEARTITNAQYPERFVRYARTTPKTGTPQRIDDGTIYAPYTLLSGVYGKQIAETTISATRTFDPTIFLFNDTLVTSTQAQAIANLAAMTIDKASKTIDFNGLNPAKAYSSLHQWLINVDQLTTSPFFTYSGDRLTLTNGWEGQNLAGTLVDVNGTTFPPVTTTLQITSVIPGSRVILYDMAGITAPDWQPSKAYSEGDRMNPPPSSGAGTDLVTFIATTDGASGSTRPTFPSTVGNTVADGTVIWEAISVALANEIIPASTYAFTKTLNYGDQAVTIALYRVNGATAKMPFIQPATLTGGTVRVAASQVDDEAYNAWGVDGSVVPGFAFTSPETIEANRTGDVNSSEFAAWFKRQKFAGELNSLFAEISGNAGT